MPTAITTDPGTTFTDFPFQQVDVSTDISNSSGWTAVDFLWCRELKLAVNGYSTAKLRYEVGAHVLQPGDTSITNYPPLSLRGKYVRINITQDSPLEDIVWVGYVLNDQLQRDGVKNEGGVNKFQGECQEFDVVGLEWWLDRKQIETSIVEADNGDGFVAINRALKFNGGESATIDMKGAHRGNRAANPLSGRYLFSDDPTSEDKWTAGDIVKYLLYWYSPTDKDSNDSPCSYDLNPTDDAAGYLNGFHPTIASEHATVYQLLNRIITPQRGLCWWLEFDSTVDDSVAYIRVASLARSQVVLTDSNTLPANANQITLSFDGELDVKSVDVTNQGKRNYHRVICRGARQTVTFTVGVQDETLVTDWKDETELAYKDAARDGSDDPEYDALTETKKKERNDAMRMSDAFSRVYAYFRIPKDWDGQSGDGATADKHYAIAEISTTGSVIGGLPLTAQGIRLLNRTRLKQGVDYEHPTSLPLETTAPDGSLEEFLSPFAILKVEAPPAISGAADPPDRWQYCEKMHEAKFHAGTKPYATIHTCYHLRMQEHVPGLILRASGAPNHTLAGEYWTGNEPTAFNPELSYDSLRATVCAEADYYATGIAEVATIPAGMPVEELIIDMGDDYRLDFLAQNTIVDLKKGVPVLADNAAVLRDDRSVLRDIARIALEWYREDRQQLKVEFRQLRNLFSLGQLITTIGAGTTQSTINTVISCITYRFDKSGTLTIETMDDTLDIRALRGGIT